jgi:RNA polymerase sigma factor (sigma-70 family)
VSAISSSSSPYEQHRDYVLAVLGRRCGWLEPGDREAILHDAYAVFLEKQRDGLLDTAAMRGPQVRAYLTQTALNKAMDESKRVGRRRSVSLDNEDLGIDPIDPGRGIDERVASTFDDARIREIVAELPERQQTIIKLRFFFDRTPDEIQRFMGMTERVYRRELERATRHIADRVELVRSGAFCDSRRSLVLAYVTGVAGPHRMAEARRHLESCPGCAAWARELRANVGRAAAVLPLPFVGVDVFRASAHRYTIAPRHARERLSELVSRSRDHALNAAVRMEPTKAIGFSGVRPGAAAAMIAGCLAAGSGATYCAVAGVPSSIRALLGIEVHHPHKSPASRMKVAIARARPPVAVLSSDVISRSTPVSAPPMSERQRVARVAPTRRSHPRHAVSHTKRAASGLGGSRQAQQVHLATSPEFGVGSGAPAHHPVASPQQTVGSPAPPKPSSHLPEFDP